jgi:outer membrane lipoprotein carrier protein
MPVPILRRFALAACAVVVAWPVPAEPQAAAVGRVERYLERLVTLRAEFTQQVLDATGAVREEAAGTLAIEKPGRFRWDYVNPSEQVLVSDGQTVWLYDVELEQVTVRDAVQSLSTTPAMLLSGQGKLGDSFVATDGGRADGLEWVQLVPKLDDTDFSRVRLGFREAELVRMDLADRLGQTTRIRFSSIERNPKLPASLFRFVPPPGVDVVGSAGLR